VNKDQAEASAGNIKKDGKIIDDETSPRQRTRNDADTDAVSVIP
jgi:hypothetical protein